MFRTLTIKYTKLISVFRMFASANAFFISSLPSIPRRFLMNSAFCMNKYAEREANMLNKLMNSSKKKRKYFICESPNLPGGALNLGKEIRNSKENSRRVAVLNKLFIKNISDLLVTGSFSETVLDKGLEITRVAMASDFRHLNVFWTTNNEKNIDCLEAILPSLGFSLRHELSQLQVIGRVPKIVFVKDKHYINMLKVDALLRIADFGEDYEPYKMESDFKLTQNPQVNISNKEENRVETDDESRTGDPEVAVELMPEMRQDTFNLDHDRIMKKITKSMKKSRALHRFEPNLAIAGEGTNSSNCSKVTINNMTNQERKKALAKFILERRLLKEMKYRDKFNAQLNIPVHEMYVNEENYECEDSSIEDFIDDVDDDHDVGSKKDKI